MESSTTFRTVIHAIVFIRLTNVKVHFCPQKPTRSSPVTFKLHHYRDSHEIYISNCPWSLRLYEFDYTHENMNYTILDKTLGKNSSLSIIWHALTKYLGPSPFPPIPMLVIGSLSKDDGYGNKNVSPKYNLALSQVFRDYSVLFTLYSTGKLSCNWMSTNGFKVKTENDCFIVICSRCRQNLKFSDFTLLFCGVRQRNARKFVLHVQHVYFSFFNQ